MRHIQILITLLLLCSTMLVAQDSSSDDPRYIIDPETGKLSMSIRVWGEVTRPGVTLVPSDADLISLLSYVGGPTDRAKLDKVRIIRFRDIENEERVVYADIEKFLETGDDSNIPVIYPNDTIVVNGTFWKVFRGALSYVTVGLQIAQLWYYISTVQGN